MFHISRIISCVRKHFLWMVLHKKVGVCVSTAIHEFKPYAYGTDRSALGQTGPSV